MLDGVVVGLGVVVGDGAPVPVPVTVQEPDDVEPVGAGDVEGAGRGDDVAEREPGGAGAVFWAVACSWQRWL